MSPASPAAAGRPSFLRIVTGAGMLTSSRVLGDLASALLFIAVSRVFGVEGTGLYAYAFAIAQIAQLLVNFGLDDYGLREYASTAEAERRRILGNALAIQCVLLVAVAIAVWLYLAVTRADPLAATLVWLLAAYQVLFNFAIMLFIPPISAQRMAAPAAAELVFRVGGTMVAVALITLGAGLAASLAALPLAATLLVVAAMVIARRSNGPLRPHLDRTLAPSMMKAALTFAASGLVAGLFAKIGLILLTFLDGAAAAGIFATGLKLLDLGMAPLLFLGIAVYPRLASSFGTDPDDLAEIAQHYVRLSIVLGALVLWGMVFVVPPILPLLLGPDFAAAGPAVQLMGVLALLTAMDLAAARLLWALRLQDRRLKIQTIGLGANITLNVALIPWLGVTGAILAAIATLALMLGLAIPPINRHLPSSAWRRLGRAGLWPAAAVGVVGGLVTLGELSPWLGGPLTLGAFVAASLLSGLFGRAQLESLTR